MRSFFPRARSWVLASLPLLLVAACDPAPTEPVGSDLRRHAAGKSLSEMIAFSSDHEGLGRALYVRVLDGLDMDQRVTSPPTGYGDSEPDFAPGSKRLVFTRTGPDGKTELYAVGVNGKRLDQLTSFGALTRNPVYSPDGRKIAFVSDKDGPVDIYVMDASGADVQRLTSTAVADYRPTWSADGTRLAYASADFAQGTRIRARDLGTGSESILVECETAWCTNPTWARNSQQIIYEISGTPGGPPSLMLRDLANDVHYVISAYQTMRVGNWKPDGSRFVAVSDDGSTLYEMVTSNYATGDYSPMATPSGTVMWPTWSR